MEGGGEEQENKFLELTFEYFINWQTKIVFTDKVGNIFDIGRKKTNKKKHKKKTRVLHYVKS